MDARIPIAWIVMGCGEPDTPLSPPAVMPPQERSSSAPDPSAPATEPNADATAADPDAAPPAAPDAAESPELPPAICMTTPVWIEVNAVAMKKPVSMTVELTYASSQEGRVLLDLVDADIDSWTDGRPRVVHGLTCTGLGELKVDLPAGLPSFVPVAFFDTDDGSPDADDPAGRAEEPVQLAAGGRFRVEMQAGADLGAFGLPHQQGWLIETPPEPAATDEDPAGEPPPVIDDPVGEPPPEPSEVPATP